MSDKGQNGNSKKGRGGGVRSLAARFEQQEGSNNNSTSSNKGVTTKPSSQRKISGSPNFELFGERIKTASKVREEPAVLRTEAIIESIRKKKMEKNEHREDSSASSPFDFKTRTEQPFTTSKIDDIPVKESDTEKPLGSENIKDTDLTDSSHMTKTIDHQTPESTDSFSSEILNQSIDNTDQEDSSVASTPEKSDLPIEAETLIPESLNQPILKGKLFILFYFNSKFEVTKVNTFFFFFHRSI